MPDYGFAIISTDITFVPDEAMMGKIEETLRALLVIGERLPKKHTESEVIRWELGPEALSYLRGAPTEMCVYLGEPTPFFDGTSIRAHSRFILEVQDGDPSALKETLEEVLGTSLEVCPYRL
ncbi:MAG TPA: hypothetical protein VGK74_11875 [Symbiobacteriaceae bacterium]|jgi:hypothetical protein